MTAGGPGREGGPGDPRVARMDYDPQTVPLPYGTTSGDPYRNYPDDGPYPGYGAGGPYGQDPDGDYDLPGRPYRRRWRVLRWLLGLVLALLMLSVIAFGVLFALTPSVANAPTLARAIATAHHAAYPGPAVPPLFAESLVATEDHRFYSEPGVDIYAIARVAAARITGHGDQGGATLYQQLAKMLYTPNRSGITVEAEQVALAVKLKFSYSRPEILRLYSDVAYFGNGYYGLEAASCGYFGRPPARMSWAQAALLAGLVQGPSADDPVTSPARARAREVHVIGRLVTTGTLTQGQGRQALRIPVRDLLARGRTGCRA